MVAVIALHSDTSNERRIIESDRDDVRFLSSY